MIRSNFHSLSFAVGILTLVSAAATPLNAQTLSVSIDGAESTVIPLAGPPPGGIQSPVQNYQGSAELENAAISWGLQLTQISPYVAAPTKLKLAKLPSAMDAIKLQNLDTVARIYSINFTLPVVVPYKTLEVDGTQKYYIATNSEGGTLSCAAGAELSSVGTDLGAQSILSNCPFNIGATGAGNATTDIPIGAMLPYAPGNGVAVSGGTLSDLTLSYHFKLTAGDTVKITPNINLFAQPICVGDLDMSFTVTAADLSGILGKWGTGDLVGDLSVDGLVEISDVVSSLGYFGKVCEVPQSTPQLPSQGGSDDSTETENSAIVGTPISVVQPNATAANVSDSAEGQAVAIAALPPSKAANVALKACSKKIRNQTKAAAKRASRKTNSRGPAMRLVDAKAMVRCIGKAK